MLSNTPYSQARTIARPPRRLHSQLPDPIGPIRVGPRSEEAQLSEERCINELDLPLRAARDRGSGVMTLQSWVEIEAVGTTTTRSNCGGDPNPVLNPLPIPIGGSME